MCHTLLGLFQHGQFQRSNEALRRRMSVMSGMFYLAQRYTALVSLVAFLPDLSCCGDAMKEIVEALKQQKHTNFSP